MNWVDAVFLGIVAWGAWNGYRRGLLKTLVGFAGFLVALIVAFIYYKELGQWLNEKLHLGQKLEPLIMGYLPVPSQVSQIKLDGLPTEKVMSLVDKVALPASYKQELTLTLQNLSSFGGGETVGQMVAVGIASLFVSIIAFLLLWFTVEHGLKWGASYLTRTMDGTPLKRINRLTGSAAGLLTSALTLIIIVGLLSPILHLGPGNRGAAPTLASGSITVKPEVKESVSIPYMIKGFDLLRGLVVKE